MYLFLFKDFCHQNHHMAKSIFFLGSLLLLVSSTCAFSHNPAAHFIFVGCSVEKYSTNTSYAQTLDRVLTSINSSAAFKPYHNLTITSSDKKEEITGQYQCRGDISMPDCTDCVLEAVSELRQLCFQYFQGIVQMEGCSVRYENSSFLGQQDTELQLRKCGPKPYSDDEDLRLKRDKVMDGLLNSSQYYRVSKSDDNNIQSRAQCMEDLHPDQCQECLVEAIRVTKRECHREFTYGDIFLGKCYVRYTIQQTQGLSSSSKGGISRSVKIIIVLTAGLLIGLVMLIAIDAFYKMVSRKGNGKEISLVSASQVKL